MFGLLADLPEARERALPGDGEATEAAVRAVEALNDKYGGGFSSSAAAERCGSGTASGRGTSASAGPAGPWRACCSGVPAGLAVLAGDPALLRDTKYISPWTRTRACCRARRGSS